MGKPRQVQVFISVLALIGVVEEERVMEVERALAYSQFVALLSLTSCTVLGKLYVRLEFKLWANRLSPLK